jgi:CMP-N-acetylneuraminic acid synthetase
VLDQQSLWGARSRPYLMDWRTSLDIDTTMDFQIAEFLIQQQDQQP